MTFKTIGLREAWKLPGTTELYSVFDITRFKGLSIIKVDGGFDLAVDDKRAFIPWANVIGADYVPGPAIPVVKAK